MGALQAQIDAFNLYYNTEREHQALAPGTTPREPWDATTKTPAPAPPEQPTSDGSHVTSMHRTVGKDGCATVLGTHFQM